MNASRATVRLAGLVLLCTVVRLSFLTSSAFASPCSRPSGGLSVPALHAESSALPNPKPHRYGSCNLALLALGLSALALRPQMTKTTRVQRFAGFGGSGLSGKWGCYKTEGDIDGYWKATGLPWLARKGLQLMDWGAGKNQNIREFSQKADDIEMEYSFQGPGLGALGFTEKYKVGNGTQVITRMGGAKILVDPVWESDSVLRVTNMSPAKQTQGWTKSVLGGSKDEDANRDASASETTDGGEVIDVHRFYIEEDNLVLEADSSPSGGPVVKWILRKLE